MMQTKELHAEKRWGLKGWMSVCVLSQHLYLERE
jgi:hypothetical protein